MVLYGLNTWHRAFRIVGGCPNYHTPFRTRVRVERKTSKEKERGVKEIREEVGELAKGRT